MATQEPIKTVGDTEIYLDANGQFYAEVRGKTVKRASLSALEAHVRKTLRVGVKCMRLNDSRYASPEDSYRLSVEEITVGAIERKDFRSRYRAVDGALLDKYGGPVYLYDEETAQAWREIQREMAETRHAFETRKRALQENAVTLTQDHLDQAQAESE